MTRSWPRSALLALTALASSATGAQTTAYALLTGDGRLAFAIDGRPQDVSSTRPVQGLSADEVLVAIDVRVQNGRLYGLAHDPKSGRVRLYHIDVAGPALRATPLGAAQQLQDASGNPLPILAQAFDMDFNPTVDRLRVIASNGLNFRLNPNDGALIDGDFGSSTPSPGINPDAPLNGGAGGAMATAYTDNRINATVTTQYTLDHRNDTLYIQQPPNAGTLIMPRPVTIGAAPLDFSAVGGLDIEPGIAAPSSGAPANGLAAAVLTVAGMARLYRIDLSSGVASLQGQLGGLNVVDLAVFALPPSVNALAHDGTRLFRFPLAHPSQTAMANVTGVAMGERLVAIDQRPTTGQLYALGIDAANDRGTLYRLEPQSAGGTARAFPVGSGTGLVAWVDGNGVPIDLSDLPVGFDFNPAVDRIRFVDASGVNARIHPDTGLSIDGDMAAPGINPDTGIQGPIGTQLIATAYTSNHSAAAASTQYTLDQFAARLFIQAPPNSGMQITPRPLTINGAPFEFRGETGFDVPPGPTSSAANAPVVGLGYFTADDPTGAATLYELELSDGSVRSRGAINTGGRTLSGLAAYDAARRVAFEASALSVDEGQVALVAILLLDGGDAPVHYRTLDATATAGSDYSAVSGTLFLNGAQPRLSFEIPILGDGINEPNEQFRVRLEGPFMAPADLVVTIRDVRDLLFRDGFEPR